MSSHRYLPGPPFPPGDNRRFVTRGARSPPRYAGDRFGQFSGVGAARGHDHPPRGDGLRDRGPQPVGRGIPRGPRASFDTPRVRGPFGYSPPRGRGFPSRADAHGVPRDREPPRDPRGLEPSVDRDRTWRDDDWDRRSSEFRVADRDRADYPAYGDQSNREIEIGRGRATLREEPQPPFSTPHHDSLGLRGRARGRADWAARGRGRGFFREDREAVAGSSRSPQPNEQRRVYEPFRNESSLEARSDKRTDGRETERLLVLDDRGRTFDPFTQDRAAARDPRSPHSPPMPQQDSSGYGPSLTLGRTPGVTSDNMAVRRAPDTHSQSDHSEARRDSLRSETRYPRIDDFNDTIMPRSSSPPQPPEVPAYGSLPFLNDSATSQRKPPTEPRATQQNFSVPAGPYSGPRPPAAPPVAPKAEVLRQPPTGPKAARAPDQVFLNSNDRGFSESRLSREAERPRNRSLPRPSLGDHENGSIPISRPPSIAGSNVMSLSLPQSAIPSGPRGSASFTPSQEIGIVVPTGPKAGRSAQQPPHRFPNGSLATQQWPRKWPPVISLPAGKAPNLLPMKRDAQGMEKREKSPEDGSSAAIAHHATPSSQYSRTIAPPESSASFGRKLALDRHVEMTPRSPAWGDEPPDFGPTSLHPQEDAKRKGASINGDDLSDAIEDVMELDEQDFEEKEQQFQRQKEKLEAEMIDLSVRHLRAATPLEHLALLGSLMLISLPGYEEVPQLSQGEEESEEKDLAVTPEPDTPDISGKYCSKFDAAPIASAELQSLPFLARATVLSFEELDVVRENDTLHNYMYQALFQHLELRNLRDDEVEQCIREEYRALYDPWMDDVEHLDQELKEDDPKDEEVQEAPPPIPLLDASPLLLSAGGGRRGGVGLGSEYDIERVLQESVQTANKEDERRRRQEASAKYDPDREADIPALLDDDERPKRVLTITGYLHASDDPRMQFALEPPLDDFTEEEHAALILNFKDFPKKWGKIAQGIGGRSYKDCINHYYSSKWDKEFKDRRDKRKPKNTRGRLKVQLSGSRPKASALISNLGDAHTDPYDGEEFSLPNVAVTDSGRPRRAAAPVFGEKEAEDNSQQTPVPARKGPKSAFLQGEGIEKGARKPRNSVKEKGAKKVRSQILNRRGSESPEKSNSQMLGPRSYDPIQDHNTGDYDIQRVQALGNLPLSINPHFSNGFPPHHSQEMMQQSEFSTSGMIAPMVKKPGMSSYWSVNESSAFRRLASELGSDWQSIAQQLGTKTAVMVKNLFKRTITGKDEPHWQELEESVKRADERRSGGDQRASSLMPMGYTKHSTDSDNQSGARGLGQLGVAAGVEDASPRNDFGGFEIPASHAIPHLPEQLATGAPQFDSQSQRPLNHHSHPFLHPSSNLFPKSERDPGDPQRTGTGSVSSLHASVPSPPLGRISVAPEHAMWWPNRNRESLQQSIGQGLMQPPSRFYDSQARDAVEPSEPQSYWQKSRLMPPPTDRPTGVLGLEQRALFSSPDQSIATRNLPSLLGQFNSPVYPLRAGQLPGGDRASETTSQTQEQRLPAPRTQAAPSTSTHAPRKQSNILSILNAEPDEPLQRTRPPTPPRQRPDFRHGESETPRSYLDRSDVSNEWRSARNGTGPSLPLQNSAVDPRHPLHTSHQPQSWFDRQDWAAHATTHSSTPATSNAMSFVHGRATPFEPYRQSVESPRGRANPSPPQSARWNHRTTHATDHRQPQSRSGPPWQQTTDIGTASQSQSSSALPSERLGYTSMGHDRMDADTRHAPHIEAIPSFTRPTETPSASYRADEGAQEQHRPLPLPHPHAQPYGHSSGRQGSSNRPDSFLLHGSGNYRSLTSQRDHHGYQERERQEREVNPFRQPQHYQRSSKAEGSADATGMSHVRAGPNESREMGLGFGPVGEDQRQQEQQRPSQYPAHGGVQGEGEG